MSESSLPKLGLDTQGKVEGGGARARGTEQQVVQYKKGGTTAV